MRGYSLDPFADLARDRMISVEEARELCALEAPPCSCADAPGAPGALEGQRTAFVIGAVVGALAGAAAGWVLGR